jgi:enterochelin esterase-like enzyme
MDTGINDSFLWSGTKMDEVLNNDRVPHFWHLGVGGHDQNYWRANLADYLSFYATGW